MLGFDVLTHWGRVMHICVSKLTIIGSDNGLSPDRRQAIIWTNAGLLLIGPIGTNFSEILIGIQTFSFKKMHLNMSSAKWRPFCLSLNVLTDEYFVLFPDGVVSTSPLSPRFNPKRIKFQKRQTTIHDEQELDAQAEDIFQHCNQDDMKHTPFELPHYPIEEHENRKREVEKQMTLRWELL